jgi:hypothetical protein
MKTSEQIQTEISEAVRSINKDSGKAEVDAVKRDVVFLRQCLRYIETTPREEFIQSQRNEIQRRIDLVPTHYEAWKTGRALSKYRDPYKAYCTEMKLSDMKAQIKTLDYLLS